MPRSRVRHVGQGRTNPETQGRLLALREYLQHGFEPGPMTEHDRHLAEGERKAEQKFAEMMEHGPTPGGENLQPIARG